MRTLIEGLELVHGLAEDIEVLSSERRSRYGPHLTLYRESWTSGDDCDPVEIWVYRNAAGDQVESRRNDRPSPLARKIKELGIEPRKAHPSHSACSYGKSSKDGKWYGWSHRAICGFAVGDKIFEPEFGDDHTPFRQHGRKTIRTDADGQKAAMAFADYVS